MKILLLTKTSDACKEIQTFVKERIPKEVDLKIFEGEFGDKFPEELKDWFGDYVISFLCPWIVPEWLLNKTKLAINFHPAPPKYPGIGCYNFAIYNKDKEYGVTCHYMISRVDSGKIVKVLRFPMYEDDTVLKLKERTIDYLVKLFHEIFACIIENKRLPESNETWERKPYTRKELQKLCKITDEMNEEEVKLRIRATYFLGARDLPYKEVNGEKVFLKNDESI
ncbi:hypothetical protein HQ533_02340 [Candidatus Woesearchaeota archaeon]|nr:hypothetical protein [Candidatus Woesearchaeota archaeon]